MSTIDQSTVEELRRLRSRRSVTELSYQRATVRWWVETAVSCAAPQYLSGMVKRVQCWSARSVRMLRSGARC